MFSSGNEQTLHTENEAKDLAWTAAAPQRVDRHGSEGVNCMSAGTASFFLSSGPLIVFPPQRMTLHSRYTPPPAPWHWTHSLKLYRSVLSCDIASLVDPKKPSHEILLPLSISLRRSHGLLSFLCFLPPFPSWPSPSSLLTSL